MKVEFEKVQKALGVAFKWGMGIVVVLILVSITRGCISQIKTGKGGSTNNTVTLPTLPTHFVGTGETIMPQIGDHYSDMWITVDPTRHWEFVVKDAEAGDDLQIRFQFRNGTQSQWISNWSDVPLGSAKWTKTFRIKTREGLATLVVKVH
jgi:hypothetical protein